MSFDQLKELFQANLLLKGTANDEERLLDRWIQGKLTETDLREALYSAPLDKATDSLDHWMDEARSLLLINLLNELEFRSEEVMLVARTHVRKSALASFWQELQVLQGILALNCEMTRLPFSYPMPDQLPNGAALLDTGNRVANKQAPLSFEQAQLGLLWALIGSRSGDQQWIDSAIGLAEWQTNLLDGDGLPLNGLLTTEKSGSFGELLAANAALFRVVARLGARGDFETLAQRQLQALYQLVDQQYVEVDPLMVLAEEWAVRYRPNFVPTPIELPSVVQDVITPMCGIRSEQGSAFGCLSGGKSGLGTLDCGSLKVLSYGPSAGPLSDGSSFGVSSESDLERHIEADPHGFSMSGRVRVDEGWFDVHQQWRSGRFSLDAIAYSIAPLEELSFCFFVSAPQVVVDGIHQLEPFSLEKYQGAVEGVELRSDHARMQLLALCGRGELEVIPLSGGHSFWGANFLIAYHFDPDVCRYGWRIRECT